MKRKLAVARRSSLPAKPGAKGLLADLREMILSARQSVATTANATLTMLHWQIGNRIRKDILREKRAEYGEQILSTLSQRLEAEFGRGFGQRNLFRMVRFAEVFPDPKILTSLMTQLGWTHFLHIIRLDDPLKRDFSVELCRIKRWSTRTLEKKIGGMLFERTAQKPEKLAAIGLKLEEFKAGDKGQMELYLKWLDRHEPKEGEQMKPRNATHTGHHTDGHGCQMESPHAVRAKCVWDGILSAARSRSAVSQIFHTRSGKLAGQRIVAAVPRQLAGRQRSSPHCGDN